MTDYLTGQADTIAAISTGMVTAGIGVIRVSGPQAVDVADRIFVPGAARNQMENTAQNGGSQQAAENAASDALSLSERRTHTIVYGTVVDEAGAMIDEVLVMLMRAPHTYTGEDTVEINCHGGLYVLSRVLDAAVRAGARMAEPGEFTKRAFLNGKMDLSRAEAVAGLIGAENERARKASVSQLSGREAAAARGFQEKILEIMAFAEAALDDPEHIDVGERIDDIRELLVKIRGQLSDLCDTAGYGRLITEGIRTVITGKPNAGKSSFLNMLLGEDRSIVSDIAGTTRDTIREKIGLGSFTLAVTDTAGITASDDPIEKIGVSRAFDEIDQADLILYIMDGSTAFDSNDEEIIRRITGRQVIGIINKSDLDQKITSAEAETKLGALGQLPLMRACAAKGQGVRELTGIIEDMFFNDAGARDDGVVLLSKRHKYAVQSAIDALDRALMGIDEGMSEEFWLVDLKDVYDAVGEITGETVGENLIDEIFSKFCMGK